MFYNCEISKFGNDEIFMIQWTFKDIRPKHIISTTAYVQNIRPVLGARTTLKKPKHSRKCELNLHLGALQSVRSFLGHPLV